jgi:hypothetical protein
MMVMKTTTKKTEGRRREGWSTPLRMISLREMLLWQRRRRRRWQLAAWSRASFWVLNPQTCREKYEFPLLTILYT